MKRRQVKIAREYLDGCSIHFPFDREVLEQVKTLPGRIYQGIKKPENKFWTIPLSKDSLQKLEEWGFEIHGDKLQELLNRSDVHVDNVEAIEVPGFKKILKFFQKKGVGFIEVKNGRALVADDMGLGKTIEALAWLQLHPKRRPVVVTCPANAKLNWAKEINECLSCKSRRVMIAEGRKSNPIPSDIDIVVINYDIVQYWIKVLKEWGPMIIIADEAHKFKNNNTGITKTMKKLEKGVKYFLPMTGTFIRNATIDIYNAVNMVDPTLFPSRFEFAKRYCDAKHNGFGWDFSGASNTKELHEKLVNTIMLRRKKEDVLPELPNKIKSFVPLEINNRKEYQGVEQDFIKFVKGEVHFDIEAVSNMMAGKQPSVVGAMAKIEYLKQAAVKGKMDSVIEWIKDTIESCGKLVVFAIHKKTIDRLMFEFKDIAVKIDGSVNSNKRQAIVDRFQEDPSVKLFVGNIDAAGESITLTSACNVAVIELPWTPGQLDQCIDRLHRITQKFCVNVYFLLAVKTIEIKIAKFLDGKKKVVDAVHDGVDTKNTSLLNELIKNYSKLKLR